MPKFYFHISTRTQILLDEEGADLAGLEEAVGEAIKDARSLMSAAILEGRDISHRHIKIADEKGQVVLTLPFKETYEPGE